MRLIGYSTGALAKGAFREALAMLRDAGVSAVELSALREEELAPLVAAAETLDLSGFAYVAVHAPSRFPAARELVVIRLLERIGSHQEWPLVIHPDVIRTPALWQSLDTRVCIENMDARKRDGRTAAELALLFSALPEARFCFDVAHVLQVDPSLCEAKRMLDLFRDRLQQVHISSLTGESSHVAISERAMEKYGELAEWIPDPVPVMVESPLPVGGDRASILREIGRARKALTSAVLQK